MLLALFFALSSFAASPFEDAIYNGRPVAADGTSWKSTVGLSFTGTDGQGYACTGSFIAADTILTAAHCRIKNGASVSIALYKENSTEATYLFADGADYRYVAHPRYRKSSAYDPGSDDVAVLVLKSATLPEDFDTVSIQTSGQARASDPGHQATVVGTGLTEKGEMADHLYFAQGVIANYLAGGVVQINFGGRVGVCGGDSGGPVFVSSGGQLYLSAITTATPTNLGKHCGNVLYANYIDAARYQWINSTAAKIRDSFIN
jgi:secreted trypsin-like serine protease